MKKLLTISLCAALVLGLSACGAPTSSGSSAPSISVVPSTPESLPAIAPEATPESDAQQEQSLPPIPADSSMYRGTVTSVTPGTSAADGPQAATFEIVLEQAEGTDFGAPSLKFAFTADTYADFTPEQGQYLEVYYGAAMGQPLDVNAVHNVLTAIKYHSAEMVNYNGYVKEIHERTDKPGQGWLMMVPTLSGENGNMDTPIIVDSKDADGSSNSGDTVIIDYVPSNNEIRFNYDKEQTQFYLNFDEIKVGDRLNIFQSGAMTMSIPPQSFAIEVRNYAKSEGTPTPKTTVTPDPNADVMGIKFDQSVYTGKEPNLYYTVTNKTSMDFGFGMGEGFQHKVDGKWVDYPTVKDLSFPDIAIVASANSSTGDSLDLSYYVTPLPTGNYRIVRQFGDKEYYAEFSVE